MTAMTPHVHSDEAVEAVWQALRERVCADPATAKRCVMVGRADLVAALSSIPAADARVEREAIVAWLRHDADQLEAVEFCHGVIIAEAIRECADAIESRAHLANREGA